MQLQKEGIQMNKFMQKVARFLMGRYGLDSLYTALMIGVMVLIVLNAFLGSFIVNLLIMALLAWSLFRSFSRNIAARRRENEIWVKIWKKITFGKGPVRDWQAYRNYGGYGSYNSYPYGQTYTTAQNPPKKKKLKTDKYHCFRICPQCKANIRLPKERGRHTVVCPRCKCRFEVKI